MTPIKSLTKSDRPREKLQMQGAQNLTTTELFMIMLGSGQKGNPVQQLSKKIEKLYSDKKHVALRDLTDIKGIGLAKACQLQAALELSERLNPRQPEEVLNSAEKVLAHLFELRSSAREQVVGLYLNARMMLVHKEVLSMGGHNQALITPKEVFSVIKHVPVTFLILAHNHPSGDTTPSLDDIAFTTRIMEASKLIGIEFLDHFIVGRNSHFSFRQSKIDLQPSRISPTTFS